MIRDNIEKHKMKIIVGAHMASAAYIFNYITYDKVPLIGIPMPTGIVVLLGISLYAFWNFYHKTPIKQRNPTTSPKAEEPKSQQPAYDIVEAFKKGTVKIKEDDG